MPYIGKSPGKLGVRTRYHYTATGSETSKSGPDDNGLTLKFDDGEYVDVYLNGSLLVAGSDYNTLTANTIGGLTALASNDILEVVVYDIYSLAKVNSEAQRTVYHKTATGGETSISGADDGGATITFPANATIDVYLNGVKLKQGDDYNTTTANTVGGLTALTAGQLVAITVYEKFVAADMVKKTGDTMTGGLSAPSIISTGNITASGNLTVDTNTLHVDATNNRVGINTTTPSVSLDIGDTQQREEIRLKSTGGGAQAVLGAYAGTESYVGSTNNVPLHFRTNGVNRAQIDTSGIYINSNQPCWFYTGGTSLTTSAYVVTKPSTAVISSSHYNTTTGLFTAPVSGKYLVGVEGLVYPHSGNVMTNRWQKNGAQYGHIVQSGGENSSHTHLSWTQLVDLAQNDTIGFAMYRSGSTENAYSGQWHQWGYFLG